MKTGLIIGATGPTGPAMVVSSVSRSVDFTIIAADKGIIHKVTTGASTLTVTLPAAVTAGDGWYIYLEKTGDGAGLIATSPTCANLSLFAAMEPYDVVMVWTDGTSYYAAIMPGSSTVPFTQYDVGTFILPTAARLLQPQRLTLSGTNRGTLRGTARVTLADNTIDADESLSTQPRSVASLYLGPDETLAFFERLQIKGNARVSITGNSRLQVVSPANATGGSLLFQANRANPATTASINPTLVMAGFAGSFIAPTSGLVYLSILGNLSNSAATAADGAVCHLRYGLGTAPTNGAALTGISIGTAGFAWTAGVAVANLTAPFHLFGPAVGLTPGALYWFDAAYAVIAGGNATITQPYLLARAS